MPRNKTVLIVDDEHFVLKMHEKIVARSGVQNILSADNVITALKILYTSEHNVDLLICDLAMPDLDGVEMIQKIINIKKKPAILFVSYMPDSVAEAAKTIAESNGFTVFPTEQKPLLYQSVITALNQI